ncbi:efflux RND transporter permease subunit [Kangiella sp. HZ709]|uniref:efflux RND transporter permease subunit n=1 Tax=Kangiella sp. HZ709 TaxID=2666328 RepID=UPI0012B1418F|nr:efflux RND transporter permease subunit [Kangiella sp. HZ709]MRX26873.1 AcrB/AcrD/AcrF family protein [Kangiella sp. HZ709]
MNIAEFSIRNKILSTLVIVFALTAGWGAYKDMPRYEDPEFVIRIAQIITQYPGASPEEVANEITDPLEKSIQQLQEVKLINSTSSAGLSEIQVEIKYEFSKSKSDLQLIWSKLRNKVRDAERYLPSEATSPAVYDDFGDVFGMYYFITGEGYSMSELRDFAKTFQSEILQVKGVAKVSFAGEQQEAIYVEISRQNALSVGADISNIYNILSQQNSIVSAGNLAIEDQRLVIDPSGAIDSVDSIKNLLISSNEGKVTYLKDIAHVWRGYQTPSSKIIRYNGKPAIAIGVSNVSGENVVKLGQRVDTKIKTLKELQPLGMEIHEYYHQGKVVDTSVQNFVTNVIAALAIVIITLLIFMGLKSALVIGAILLLTIAATLATMNLVSIPMHRISLGALIIALGMMVDNAIVVTEGILVGVKNGQKRMAIAKSIVSQTKWPLLGGTLVGIVAFAPIGFAPGSTAEYTQHLFWVILISLMFSWLFAITLTPLFCYHLFKGEASNSKTSEGRFLLGYKKFLSHLIDKRIFVVATVLVIFAVSAWGFKFVKSGFFPASTTPQLVVDYWLPEGTDITQAEKDAIAIETYIRGLDSVNSVQTLIGAGGLRYMLIYSPESPNSSYAQLLVKVDDYKKLDNLLIEVQQYIDNNYNNAQAKVWRFVLGPGGGSKIEATFKGPDPKILRNLANQAKAIMIKDGQALSIKDNWREPVPFIEPIYSERLGRASGISREDLANALALNFSGRTVGAYREGNDILPIISRAPSNERADVNSINDILVQSSTTGNLIPIAQVVEGFNTQWRDSRLRREDRVWTIKAQSDPLPGNLSSELFERIRPQIESIALPPGYQLEWDGEYGDSKESNENLASTIPLGFLTMVIIVLLLFNAIKQTVVIWLVVPLAIIGVVWGLVVTQIPMEFMGILGVLSLSGLLIKNAIVLVDQMDFEIEEGKPRFNAVLDSAASRLRPVMMGTLTTVLGVIPLFFDAFFQSMAVVLVFGLSFATILTLVIVPVLYSMFFKITSQESHNA